MSAPVIVTIRPGVAFEPAAAASWRRMEAAVGRHIDVNRSYADYASQYQYWWNYTHHVPGAPFALHPDQSLHCKGLAVDTDDQTLMKRMGSHGWRQTALATGEPWHFQYFRSLDQHQGQPAGGTPTPTPDPIPEQEDEEDDMRMIFGHRNEGADEWMIVHPTLTGDDDKQLGYLVTTDHERAKAWARMYAKGWAAGYDFDVNRADYIAIQEAARAVHAATQTG